MADDESGSSQAGAGARPAPRPVPDTHLPREPLVVGLTGALDRASAARPGAPRRAAAKDAARDDAAIEHERIVRMTHPAAKPAGAGRRAPLTDVDFPRLSTFSGYLGNAVTQADSTVWRLLYLDEKLWTWLLIRQDDIVFHDRIKDEKAAFGLRDVVWLDADATIGEGSGTRSPQTRFLGGATSRMPGTSRRRCPAARSTRRLESSAKRRLPGAVRGHRAR